MTRETPSPAKKCSSLDRRSEWPDERIRRRDRNHDLLVPVARAPRVKQ